MNYFWRRNKETQTAYESDFTQRFLDVSAAFRNKVNAYETLRDSIMPEIHGYLEKGNAQAASDGIADMRHVLQEVCQSCNSTIQVAKEERVPEEVIIGIANFFHMCDRDQTMYSDLALATQLIKKATDFPMPDKE
ncbi:MAG: hypothetical protein HY514_04795 [Candidatus Aenigmarchaeota archaeon]|nr:hypothetical protein [Candidatus Aenigmarchaeota archaeon]